MKNVFVILCSLFCTWQTVDAHVGYLIPKTPMVSGTDTSFLVQAFTNTHDIWIVIGSIFVIIIFLILEHYIPVLRREVAHIKERVDSYSVFIPWILRLSVGIALIGAGIHGYLLSPVTDSVVTAFSTLQVVLGFFMLSGFLVMPTAIAILVLYIYALTYETYIIGNLEMLGAVLALLLLDNERPGLDDLLGIPHLSPLKRWKSYAPLVLRLTIGIAMLFLALYEKMLNPHWAGLVVEQFGLQHIIPVSVPLWVFGTGIVELVIGVALIIGFRTRLVSAIAFIVLSLSFFYFGEEVTSHITLFGVLSTLFITQGGPLSTDNFFNKNPTIYLKK